MCFEVIENETDLCTHSEMLIDFFKQKKVNF